MAEVAKTIADPGSNALIRIPAKGRRHLRRHAHRGGKDSGTRGWVDSFGLTKP